MAFKTFTNGSILTDTDLNTYLMKQAVVVCTSGTRPASPVEGMLVYETDTDRLSSYDGTSWHTVYDAAPSWTTITGWSANVSGDSTMVPQSYSINGLVHLRGRVNHSTAFSGNAFNVGTLPSGIRPSVERNFAIARMWATSDDSAARLRIESTGVLTYYSATNDATWISLDGIYFYIS